MIDLLNAPARATPLGRAEKGGTTMSLSNTRRSGALLISFVALIALCGSASQAASQDSLPLAKVDLSSMAGGWYIIATIPNCLERGVVAGYDVFTPQAKGEILEDFYMQKGGFREETLHFSTSIAILPNSYNADWRVHILGPVRLPFQVLYVDPKDRFVLFGEQNRDWGWIYSRKQLVTDKEYDLMLSHFKSLGYKTDRFLKFVQIPAQIGQPGYWSDGVQ